MPKLRIGVLYDIWWVQEEPSPPKEANAPKEPNAPKEANGPKDAGPPKRKKKERLVHQEVYHALKESGHNPFYLILEGDDESLVRIPETKTDLIFNLSESYAGDDTKDTNIAAYLDLLDRRYTGAGPNGLYLAQDKSLAKKIFAFHGLKTPFFATVYRGRVDWSDDIRFPVIVKPSREDGSIGIGFRSVVDSIKDLMERIDAIHERFDSPALIEEYIEGREIYVGVFGNDRLETLPIVELDLSHIPEGQRIAGHEVKWRVGTDAYEKADPFFPDDLDEETVERIRHTAIEAYKALKLRDYGRIDLRLAADGTPYVIEVNPNCWLSHQAEFAFAAKKSGRSYEAMIEEIVTLALARYGVTNGG